jgi:hypothetical protein
MSCSMSFDLENFSHGLQTLAKAGKSIAHRALAAGASTAARAMRTAAETDLIRRSIGWRFGKSKTRIFAIVGVNVGKASARAKGTQWAAACVQGTKMRFRTTRLGNHAYTGTIPPHPAIGRAVSSASSQIEDAIKRSAEAQIKKLR